MAYIAKHDPSSKTKRCNTAKRASDVDRRKWARLPLGGGRDGAVDAQEGHAARGQVGADDVQHDARLAEQQRAVALRDQARQQPPDELRLARRRRAWRAHMPTYITPCRAASPECSWLFNLARPAYALYAITLPSQRDPEQVSSCQQCFDAKMQST